MNSNKQNLISKILYRSRYRGTKEMDIMMTSFVESIIYKLSIEELENLDQIINLNDEKILDLIDNDIINENYNTDIVQKLKKFKEEL